jgi:hypothetical protein
MKSEFASDASYDIAVYEAERAKRRPVTLRFYMDEMCDAAAWTFNAEAFELGLDPWREVTGIDCRPDGSEYWLEYSGGASRPLPPDHRIFVQIKDLNKAFEMRQKMST